MAILRAQRRRRSHDRERARRARQHRPPSPPVRDVLERGRSGPTHRLAETRGCYDAGGVGRLRVVIVDPHPLTRSGIAAVLADDPRLDVVAAAHDVAELIGSGAMATSVDAIVAVVDDVVDVADLTDPPDAGPLIVVARLVSDAGLLAAFGVGLRGVVLHDSEPSTLRGAVTAVGAGGTYIDPRLTGRLLQMAHRGQRASEDPLGLTVQERRVLRLAAEDLTNPQIADQLGLSVNTVKDHLSSAYGKLGVRGREDAVRVVREHG
ncbi:MAG: response regulator transcription factor [Actinobacteria bacterium]|nr:response regulator transcription factor [Actinomycetota bacterium]